jgi:hypothetical protein
MLSLQNELAARMAGPSREVAEINENQNYAMHTDGNSAALYSRR